ncbi:hypothetical protein DIU31_016250 [Mucilaginibacter rubeus]|uniref:DUF1330 domain-containing protein n=1 Tax=Mucilaginibacter rubeus TaxID=2027860 RepID=A0AAE6JG88_9SPHI|nr:MULTISPECIES: hypothetical protein [Mucilaginibacter]QEM04990.1 hypothetical protein DIU31_016250 [Mucilaginibacter rubeus]QEM17584.1 hypothetical protein DIU38_016415 [Mucilaginibacter gossypii]QTE45895.1 hypothetical protein J3L19_11270 [Mucilaginibacter rubeus]QTE52492.1 hypothetical protein J3L21_11240 [Mucilaginibacter rubeus]QTE57581.1 hypothetical protein J3L23_02915 [Mucilaginibacter rubeus]
MNFFAAGPGDLCVMENKKTVVKIPDNVPGTGPVLMVNLLKFADRRLYLEEYLPAFNRVVKTLGLEANVKLVTNVLASVVADEGEDWDAIAIVEYASAETFLTVAQSAAYHEIAEPLRLAGTAKLKLYMTRQFEL